MNVDEIIRKNELLEEENKKLQDELIKTKEHLNIYPFVSIRRIVLSLNLPVW